MIFFKKNIVFFLLVKASMTIGMESIWEKKTDYDPRQMYLKKPTKPISYREKDIFFIPLKLEIIKIHRPKSICVWDNH